MHKDAQKAVQILEVTDCRKQQVLCTSYTRQIIKDSLTDLVHAIAKHDKSF